MPVAFDASSESHTGITGSTNQASFTWTHTPVGSPKGVLVFTFVNANSDDASSVSYGSSSLTAVSGGRANSSHATNPGDCKAWFLGSGVPTGSQTVTVNRTNNSNVMYAVAVTITADTDTSVHTAGIVLITSSGSSLSEQSVTDGSPGTNSLRFAGFNGGWENWNEDPDNFPSDNVLKGSNSSWLDNTATFGSSGVTGIIDFGSRGCAVVKETTAGQGSRSVGFTASSTAFPAPSLARAAVHLAIKESVSKKVKDMINGFGVLPFAR